MIGSIQLVEAVVQHQHPTLMEIANVGSYAKVMPRSAEASLYLNTVPQAMMQILPFAMTE